MDHLIIKKAVDDRHEYALKTKQKHAFEFLHVLYMKPYHRLHVMHNLYSILGVSSLQNRTS